MKNDDRVTCRQQRQRKPLQHALLPQPQVFTRLRFRTLSKLIACRKAMSYLHSSLIPSYQLIVCYRRLVETVSDCLVKCRTKAASGVCSASLLEVRVLASLLGGNATSWIIDEHHFKKVESMVVKVDAQGYVWVSLPFGERWLEVWEAGLVGDARPLLLGRGTQQPVLRVRICNLLAETYILEDLEDFIDLGISWEERLLGAHLREDTSNRPHVHTGRVLTTT